MIDDAATRFGEVVEASVETLIGQCHRLYEAPPLGTLVRAGDDVYGIVSGIVTSALDPTRRVIARGADAATEAEVYAAHPQLERLLRTDVTIAVVGHRPPPDDAPRRNDGPFAQYLPPLPPRIHTFLYACGAAEARAFLGFDGGSLDGGSLDGKRGDAASVRLDFVSLLIGGGPAHDDVLAAALRRASLAFDAPAEFLLAASRAVAVLLANDTARLNTILRRLPLDQS